MHRAELSAFGSKVDGWYAQGLGSTNGTVLESARATAIL